ncbi:MAG: hypothetical protein QM765_52440 [Myxococcales bacterium]
MLVDPNGELLGGQRPVRLPKRRHHQLEPGPAVVPVVCQRRQEMIAGLGVLAHPPVDPGEAPAQVVAGGLVCAEDGALERGDRRVLHASAPGRRDQVGGVAVVEGQLLRPAHQLDEGAVGTPILEQAGGHAAVEVELDRGVRAGELLLVERLDLDRRQPAVVVVGDVVPGSGARPGAPRSGGLRP